MMIEGLKISIIGVTWVFFGLALVWILVALLNRFFPGKEESQAPVAGPDAAPCASYPIEPAGVDVLTEERAQVAAIVAAAVLAGALPLRPEAPVGPEFEHGRTAPTWVTGNRARALQPWQPPRHPAH